MYAWQLYIFITRLFDYLVLDVFLIVKVYSRNERQLYISLQ